MDNLNWLLQGFEQAATPTNLMYAVIGVLLGTAVGVLPGIGPATAEQVVATLRRKVTKFALSPAGAATPETAAAAGSVDGKILDEAYQALMNLGHSPVEARSRLDKVLASGRKFQTAQEIILEIYK